MISILGVVLITGFAFFGTMIDNFFAFSAQLMVTERSRYNQVCWAQALGVALLIVIARTLGSLLAPIPVRWIGVLCVVPFAFAVQSWRRRMTPRQEFRRGAFTTLAITVSLGGDNLAVWIPLFRSNDVARALYAIATMVILEIVFVSIARGVASHHRVVQWGNNRSGFFMPILYALLGIAILFECHTM